jgi:hypothetical protein
MHEKRAAAQRAAAEARARAAQAEARAAAEEEARDLMAGLRGLGCRADEARRAVEFCQALPDATFEERMRAALRFIGRKRFRNRPWGWAPPAKDESGCSRNDVGCSSHHVSAEVG